MKKYLFFFIFLFTSFKISYANEIENQNKEIAISKEDRIKELDKEIKYLEDLKRGFEGKAVKCENRAQELQFQSNQMVEAKRYWRLADINRRAAKNIQEEINLRKEEKNKLLGK